MIGNISQELAVFFFIAAGLGGILRSVKFGDIFEELIVRVLFGVAIFPVIAIPVASFSALTPLVMCAIAVVCLVLSDFSRWKIIAILKEKNIFIVLFMALVLFGVYYAGFDSHNWLEDGDPNGHAEAASYISHYHTYNKPVDLFITRYIEPYPVGYQLWMGLLSQLNGNVNNVLKVFNALFIVLTLPAFYYFVKKLFNNPSHALFATFVLFALPAFSTRFIFSQSLAMLQMIVAFYFLAGVVRGEKLNFIWAGLALGALCLTHQTTGVVMGVLVAIWFVVDSVYNKKINREFIFALVVALLVASPWWISQFTRYGWENIKYQLNLGRLGETSFGLTDPQLKFYTIGDLVSVPVDNIMDNMTGFGIFVFACSVIWVGAFIIYGAFIKKLKELEEGDYLMLAWLIFTVLALFSNWLPVSFIPSRMWVYVSIPAAIITGIILSWFYTAKYEVTKALFYVLVVGILLTSLYPKAEFNSREWPSARLRNADEYTMAGFLYNLPVGTKVMDACYYERVWGLNLWDDPLDKDSISIRNIAVNKTYGWDSEGWLKLSSRWDSYILIKEPVELYNLIKKKNYEYVIMGSECMQISKMSSDDLKRRVSEMSSSGSFKVAYNAGNEYVLKLN